MKGAKTMFDKLRKSKNKANIEALMSEQYTQRYFDECKFIWKNYVPKSGQSDVLQGELLRQIEKLRCEAQDNGNINWDEDFAFFCGFLKETLCSQNIFSKEEKEKFGLILDYFRDCGDYAMSWNSGEIPDDELDVNRIAYTQDNLYDMIADAIGQLYSNDPSPIPYEKNENIVR